nr:transmembrane emp24 domain-containing protein p24beta2-like [Tanacetum cinerariifolium]
MCLIKVLVDLLASDDMVHEVMRQLCITKVKPTRILAGHRHKNSVCSHGGSNDLLPAKLEEAIYNIYLNNIGYKLENDRQAVVNKKKGKRAVHKALIESAALIGASILQDYILQHLLS